MNPLSTTQKIVLKSFMGLFSLFAFVQLNDPDPLIWIFIYLIPVFVFNAQLLRRGMGTFGQITLGLVYVLWAAEQFPPEWEGVLLDSMAMKTLNIELGRESLGLAMVGFCLIITSKIH
ncbi:MAG: transmembrane 220 family protein [Spirosomataceae bacterium]